MKPFQLCENTWTSHLPYGRPLTLSPLSHQALKITKFCLQSLDISPSCALIAFGPPTLVSHICKLHESGFSGDHLKSAGHLRWKNSPLVHAFLFGLWSLCCESLPFVFSLIFKSIMTFNCKFAFRAVVTKTLLCWPRRHY